MAAAAREMVTETDSSGRFTYVSPACSDVLGYSEEELLARGPIRLLHPDDHEAFLEQVRGHDEEGDAFAVAPHRLQRRDGSWIWAEATGVRYRRSDGELCLIGVARDITERIEAEQTRRMLERQIRRAQKLESLGVLAGGIAHDFNNYLTPILGGAGLIAAEIEDDSRLHPHVESIRKAARRASALTGQMLAYAGENEPQLEALDLSEAVLEMQLLLESTISHRARLVLSLESGLPAVEADPEQVGQLIMNLVANAAEAVSDESGTIEIATGLLHADPALLDDCLLGGQRVEGPCVYISVRDDGEGIGEDVLGRIFDPFFSTRFTGRGLGLAVVRGIVQGHGGALQIVTEPGRGAQFRVMIPVSASTPVAVGGRSNRPTEGPGDRVGDGAFLLVDDDEGARELGEILLRRAGFTVYSAIDGPEAIELFRRYQAGTRGVVLDMTMPGMSGTVVVEALREIAPDVPILLTSGYSRERIPPELLDRGKVGFLPKPFDATQLEIALRRLLEPI